MRSTPFHSTLSMGVMKNSLEHESNESWKNYLSVNSKVSKEYDRFSPATKVVTSPLFSLVDTVYPHPSLLSMTSETNVSFLTYLIILSTCILFYLIYLILPRGLRHYICGTKRRYRRQNSRHVIRQQSTLSSDYNNRFYFQPTQFVSRGLNLARITDQYWGVSPQYSIRSAPTYTGFRTTSSKDDTWRSPISEDTSYEIDSIGNTINHLKVYLAQPPGIKMLAHGTKCNPRHVYITLHFYEEIHQYVLPALEYQNCLTWRTELRKSNEGRAGGSLKLGNLRRVSFEDVLGVHRGKVTTALRRMQTAKLVDAETCFSLLTKSGTLDLQCCRVVNISAEEVRESFIELLRAALRSRGTTLNEPNHLVSPGTSSSHNSNDDFNGIYASSAVVVSSKQNTSPISENAVSQLDGSSSLVSRDANLSVISF